RRFGNVARSTRYRSESSEPCGSKNRLLAGNGGMHHCRCRLLLPRHMSASNLRILSSVIHHGKEGDPLSCGVFFFLKAEYTNIFDITHLYFQASFTYPHNDNVFFTTHNNAAIILFLRFYFTPNTWDVVRRVS